ncbi:MAG: hypothetical protein EPO10_21750 [Reyranella sp.]|uniref:hypothetical protein n=1 Tax=Reyranella sp. TaxID=1929291 RepID=UPI0012036BB9|nr:hypothetical protein [Reyranella sp.]TAJ90317.1 MAG: hypothetical protein EPO41_17945 [Reyranella sp.]TBR26730.1 MAG: hypothetical protein EPO10_21750 [Reyranella sp.]
MLKRRSVIAAGLSLAAAPVLARTAAAQGATKGTKPILIFAGDETSEACKVWRTQWEPLFKQAPVFQKVDYRVVFPKTPALLLKPASWPSDLRWVLDAFLMSQVGVEQGAETPRFFLVQNGQITFTAVGNNAWRDVMWPTLLDVTNSQP